MEEVDNLFTDEEPSYQGYQEEHQIDLMATENVADDACCCGEDEEEDLGANSTF
jgi:hypothetical protein